jgi:hypothetical protein
MRSRICLAVHQTAGVRQALFRWAFRLDREISGEEGTLSRGLWKPQNPMAVVDAPSEFRRTPEAEQPQDLTAHDCINIRLPTYGSIYAWEFEKRGRALKVRVEGELVFNNLVLCWSKRGTLAQPRTNFRR